ncbi:MAG TPA: DUF4270 family protein [Chryseosolibacter sp.]
MNLWAKSLRQLSFVAVALFFFSCEDENTLLGFRNPVPKFDVSFVEIPLTSNVQRIDSIITDNKGGSGSLIVGQYYDMTFGEVKAESYLQVSHVGGAAIPQDAVLDSITFQVRYNFYHYGFDDSRIFQFRIHELTEGLDRTLVKRYFYNDAVGYNTVPMALTKVIVDADTLKKHYAANLNSQDTLLSTVTLPREFGEKIFRMAQLYTFTPDSTGDDVTTRKEVDAFYQTVKGLALAPTENNGMLGLRILNNFSGVRLHYRTFSSGAVKDTLTRFFPFGGPSFSGVQVTRTAPLSALLPYQSLTEPTTSGPRFVQSGNPVITKLDLTNFYSFVDTVGSIIINEAALVIDGVESPATTPAISKMGLKIMNENNSFANIRVTQDRTDLAPYFTRGMIITDVAHYFISPEIPTQQASVASIDFSDGRYAGLITLFSQQLLKLRESTQRPINYIGLYPVAPSVSSSVHRTVFNAENVKLRIYYTKPTLTTTPN